LRNGPLETEFRVYLDFLFYKTGIYVANDTTVLGDGAVRVIGWGEQDGDKYWIGANSWGTNWGMNGYFWMKID
jgi:C1A family cysteine protease